VALVVVVMDNHTQVDFLLQLELQIQVVAEVVAEVNVMSLEELELLADQA
jgi:hypothetical protein